MSHFLRTPSEPASAAAKPDHGRVEALDVLRLVAALAVATFHFGFNGPTGIYGVYVAVPELSGFARYGYLGVQLFFTISGFVIAYSAVGRTASQFAISRVARLYPAFVFCMTLTFLLTMTLGAPWFEVSFKQWAANLVITSTALHQPYMDTVYWTLIIEMIFYIWIGVLLAIGAFPRHILPIILGWLTLSVINEAWIGSYVIRKLFLTDQCGFFACGMLLFEMQRSSGKAWVKPLFMLAALVAVAQAVKNVEGWRIITHQEFSNTVVAWMAAGIVGLVALASGIKRLPWPARVTFALGGMTYPVYLMNQMIGYDVFWQLSPYVPPLVLFCIILMLLLLASWAVWKYVDRPGQKLLKAWLTRNAGAAGEVIQQRLRAATR